MLGTFGVPVPPFDCATSLLMLSYFLLQLVAMMSGSALKPNEETHKQMEACFAYNNPQRAS